MNFEFFTRLRYRIWPDYAVGEILSKRWTETAIPTTLLVLVFAVLANHVQNFLTIGALVSISRQAGEIGLIVMGLGLVMIVGGIDLSVGSTFALTNLMALLAMNVWGWSVVSTALATLGLGALLGAVNGVLVGYLRLRAFLTTLITLIVYRAAYDMLVLRYSTAISANLPDSEAWNWLGSGTILGVPTVAAICVATALGLSSHAPPLGMARHRHWRIEAVGLQFRNFGLEDGCVLLRGRRRPHIDWSSLLRLASRPWAATLARAGK